MTITIIDGVSGAQSVPASQAQLDAAIRSDDSVELDGVLATIEESGSTIFLNGIDTASFFVPAPVNTTLTPGEQLVAGTEPTDIMTDTGFPTVSTPVISSNMLLIGVAVVLLVLLAD